MPVVPEPENGSRIKSFSFEYETFGVFTKKDFVDFYFVDENNKIYRYET